MNLLNVRDASSLQLTRQRPEFLILKKALTGVFVIVETNKGPDETKRRRKIRNLVEAAGMFTFDRTDSVGNTTTMTVAVRIQLLVSVITILIIVGCAPGILSECLQTSDSVS
jgi:hypothetical protein